MLLPVARQVTTAVAFHPVDSGDAVAFTPVGDRLGGGDLGQKLADIFAGGGGVQYYLMDGEGGEMRRPRRPEHRRRPRVPVISLVDGKVTAIKAYSVLGRYKDVEIDIGLAADPSLLLIVTHVTRPKVEIGDVVQRGTTALGSVRRFRRLWTRRSASTPRTTATTCS